MSAVYPLDLEREIDRRWFHRVITESDRDELKPSRREQGRLLMDF